MEEAQFVCPCCAAKMTWSREEEKWACSFCHHTYDDDLIRQYHQAVTASETPSDLKWEPYVGQQRNDIRGCRCPRCGLVLEAMEGQHACCPQCGQPGMTEHTVQGARQPDGVIPFQIDREQAQAAFRRFLRHRPLLPRRFARKKQMREMTGVFVPCWLFDCQVEADLSYSATRNVTWREEKFRVTRTDHFLSRRKGSMAFEGVLTNASSRLGLGHDTGLFDMNRLQDYTSRNVEGHGAVCGDMGVETGIRRANERMDALIRASAHRTTGQYDAAMLKNIHVDITRGKIRYVWLPIWRLNGRYRRKQHVFLVNGQTGTVSGEMPVSVHQCMLWTLFLGVLFGAAFLGLAALVKIGQLKAGFLKNWWECMLTLMPQWGWFAAAGAAAALLLVMRMRSHMIRDRKKALEGQDTSLGEFRLEEAKDLLMYTTASRTRVEADGNRKKQSITMPGHARPGKNNT